MRRWSTPSAGAVGDWDCAGAIGRRTAAKMVIANNRFQRMSRAILPLLWGGKSCGVPFSLRENGHKFEVSLYTHGRIALALTKHLLAHRRGERPDCLP